MKKKKYLLYWGRGSGIFMLLAYNIILVISQLTTQFYEPSYLTIGLFNLFASLLTIGSFSIGVGKLK